ncbi:protein CHLOROPLAST IMPORT APPARATUS 2-like [Salvia splendens]|uniref:protein CHLOROPLAST IMPORT APPARATUS 2-like n=1 Tax=Salvia splendens TaxID=180675 RepID=UPI001C258382|nr:protein CHLOROPLAST IMPORT APPARATUS 2-like [Salvia splendens]
MSSSCLSRAYRLEALDLDIIKSPSSTWISSSSSPSSTLSESTTCNSNTNSVSTRKPRTPRKRPNQTYNEAAAILSTAYPKIFPAAKPGNSRGGAFSFEPSELLMPLRQVDTWRLLLDLDLEKPVDIKGLSALEKPGLSLPEISNSSRCEEDEEEFDAESILEEEIGGGIESILGNLEMDNKENDAPVNNTFCYGYPVGLGLESRAMRGADEWWKFPCVNVVDVNPNVAIAGGKKKKKVEIKKVEEEEEETEDSVSAEPNAGMLGLRLNYDGVARAWSDKPWPFSEESSESDVRARLGRIELFSEKGGVREASVQRYKEKRRTRLFSKKIRYQVRKVNADRRPRMKGRFVRTPTDSDD